VTAASARPSTRLRILKDTVDYSASTTVSQGLNLGLGLWMAHVLAPAEFGLWNALSLVLVYGAYVDFGIVSAMGRDLPFYYGQNETEQAARLEGAARWATLAGGVLAAAVIAAVSLRADLSPTMKIGLRMMAATLVLQQAYTYHRIVLRGHNKFRELSVQQLLQSLTTVVVAVVGMAAFGLFGRMLAALLAQATVLVYAVYRDPWQSIPRFSGSLTRRLMLVGLPITLSGFIVSMVTTVDRLMVISFLGSTELGYFGFALLVTSVVTLVPATASQVLFPRITYQFGQSGSDIGALRTFALTPPVVLASLLPIVIGPLYLILPFAVAQFLPEYEPGVTAIRIILIGIFWLATMGLADYFLLTTGKLRQSVLFAALALCFNVVADYVALRLGYGIEGVAVTGTLLTYSLYACVVIGYVLSHYTRKLSEWRDYFLRLWVPFGYMVVMLWLVDVWLGEWLPSGGTVSERAAVVIGKSALYLAAMFPLLVAAAREMKVDLSLASLRHLRSAR
jgi:O-antigen/teichoic acid export membrane protein